MGELPSGTVTFLFTDIEGSSRLWEQQPDAMRLALERHDACLRAAIETNGGRVFKTVGDAFCAAFTTAAEALDAAIAAQTTLRNLTPGAVAASRDLALRVRMAIHAGAAEERAGDYWGPSLNRVARILSVAHGGQVLLSLSAAELVRDDLPPGAALRDLGQHRLRDLQRPERLFQVVHPELEAEFPPPRALDAFPHNLPQQLTSFIGRRRELAEARGLLAGTRLLTLSGAGGAGKTRLSLQLAAEALEEYPDGVWLVELAPLGDPARVPGAVAEALRVAEHGGRPVLELLTEHLRSRRLLLLLDNCEHLLDACASLAEALLRACPQLQILASSREALGIPGETVYRVPSLSLPEPGRGASPQQLSQYEAVRLFIDRAVATRPGFAVTNANAPAVAQICHRLDGIPLAIELAAARLRVLTPDQIAGRLDDRFRLLTGGSRTALPRQQTLRALIDWSYDLLDPCDRALLRRLSVFAGGWTLEAAEAVCPDGDDLPAAECQRLTREGVLDLLAELVDKSLVLCEEQDGAARYRMLETVRQYARDRLLESSEAEAVRSRHLAYYLGLAERAKEVGWGRALGPWLARLAPEHDNLRAALEWTASGEWGAPGTRNQEPGTGAAVELRLATAAWHFWRVRGHFNEARDRIEGALARAGDAAPAALRGEALVALGSVANFQGNYSRARAVLREALVLLPPEAVEPVTHALFASGVAAYLEGDFTEGARQLQRGVAHARETGNRVFTAFGLAHLGLLSLFAGNVEGAARAAEEAQALARAAESPVALGLAHLVAGAASFCRAEPDLERAAEGAERSLAVARELRDPWLVATAQRVLGSIAAARGEPEQAAERFRAGLALSRDLDDRLGLAMSLEGLAGALGAAAEREEQAERAALLAGAAETLWAALGTRWPAAFEAEARRGLDAARALLGARAFARAERRGAGLSRMEAIALGLGEDGEGAPG